MPVTPTRQALLPFDSALQQLLAQATPLPDTQQVDTLNADGRVLAQDAVSALHVPLHDNSAMDGYALRRVDMAAVGVVLPVAQRIAAGTVGQPLQPGTAARIFTGAPVPQGSYAVVMQEDCTVVAEATDTAPARVQINVQPFEGQNIRRAGEDVARGAVVLARGCRLGPAELGLAASIGLARLEVVRRPRVALFSTGDELVMPGAVAP
ncbi:MAG: hypothetical protein RIR09_2316, partial [Pseudomonadota bacterium]